MHRLRRRLADPAAPAAAPPAAPAAGADAAARHRGARRRRAWRIRPRRPARTGADDRPRATHEDSAEHSLLGDPAAAVRRLADRLGAIEAPALPFVGALDASARARLVRPATGVAAAIGTIPLLGALPFYPTGWAVVLGILVGLLAVAGRCWRCCWLGALALPLVGNLALGLVAPAAVVVLAWPVLTAADRRRAVLPALAPPLALLGLAPLYLLAATTSARAHVRFALGAAGPLAIALAAGLAGRPLGLSDTAPGRGAERGAGAASTTRSTRRASCSTPPARPPSASPWRGASWRWSAGPRCSSPARAPPGSAPSWLSIAAALTVLLPVVWGAPPAPLAPTAVGTMLVAILLAFRSALVEAGGDPATSDHARSTPQDG